MAFDTLPPIPQSQELIDIALSTAKKKASLKKSVLKRSQGKARIPEVVRVQSISVRLNKDLQAIITSFPSLESLSTFYQKMIQTLLSKTELKQSLGRLQGTKRQISIISTKAERTLRTCPEGEVKQVIGKYIGRISSFIYQLKDALLYLEEARKEFRTWPSIKELPTVALVGFPNVGKSTLLSKMTTANPKIANYAFTTTIINVGYLKLGYHKVQMLDTPGTLERFEKMNSIEKIAHVAQKYAADILVLVIDPTQDLEVQQALYERIKAKRKPYLLYISKTDIVSDVSDVHAQFPKAFTDMDALKDVLKEKLL